MSVLNYYFSDRNFENSKKYLMLRGINLETIEKIKKKKNEINKLEKEINSLRSKKNINSNFIEENKKKGLNIRKEIKKLEAIEKKLKKEIEKELNFLPNIPILNEELVNFNNSEEEYKIIKEKIYTDEKKNEIKGEEIIRKLIIWKKTPDFSGSKFVIYKEYGSNLLHFLINLLREENRKNGYSLFDLPYLVKEEALYNTGQLPKFRDDLYKIEEKNLYLIPTSEVTLINMYKDEIISEEKLPIKISSYSPCFRLEAGKHGKENKSLFRLHQFNKVELVKITKIEESYEELKKMTEDACKILDKLKISHRIVDLGYKELNASSIKTYDIQIYLPNSKEWIEISSCSNCTSFQSKRAKIRIKKKTGNKYNPHILNGSSLAIDRLIIAICEYYYDSKENKIKIPNFDF